MLKRALILTFMITVIVSMISDTAAANPVAIDPVGISLGGFLILFLMNFPINTMMYMCLLFLIIKIRRNNNTFTEKPNDFFNRVISVSMAATFAGAAIDSLMIFYMATTSFYIDFLLFIIIGLFLVFMTFYFAIISLQKLSNSSALFISLGVTIVNASVWSMIFIADFIFFGFAIIILTFSYTFLAIVYMVFSYWYEKNHTRAKIYIMGAIIANQKGNTQPLLIPKQYRNTKY